VTEKIGVEMDVNFGKADATLKKTRAEALTLAGGFEKLDRASTLSAKAVGALGGSMSQLGSSSSSVLRGLGDVVGLLSSGSGLAIGLAVTTAAAVKGYEAWKEYEENLKIASLAIDEITVNTQRMTNEALQPGIKAAQDLARALASVGATPVQVQRETQSALVDSLEKKRKGVGAGAFAAFQKGDLETAERLNLRAKQLDAALASARATYEEIVNLDVATTKRTEEYRLEQERQARDKDAAAKAVRLEQEYQKRVADRASAFEADTGSPASTSLTSDVMGGKKIGLAAEVEKAQQKAAENRLREQEKQLEQERRAAEKAAGERRRILEMEVKAEEDLNVLRLAQGDAIREAELRSYESAKLRELAIARAVEQQKQSYAREASSVIISTAQAATQAATQAALESSSGWEEIVGGVLGAVAVQAGGVIMAKGAEVTGVGVGNLLLGNPLGAAQVAGGLGLVGAGVAITAGGPTVISNIVSQLSGKQIGGGGSGSGREAVGTGERGFGRRSKQSGGGSSGDSGPLQIVNVWGVDGPQAEDQARRTVADQRLARRRGFR
jgi:hypothetical protein